MERSGGGYFASRVGPLANLSPLAQDEVLGTYRARLHSLQDVEVSTAFSGCLRGQHSHQSHTSRLVRSTFWSLTQ
eukprot:3762003-Amphidinium_carterae.1